MKDLSIIRLAVGAGVSAALLAILSFREELYSLMFVDIVLLLVNIDIVRKILTYRRDLP